MWQTVIFMFHLKYGETMGGKINLYKEDSDKKSLENSNSKFTQNKRLDLNDLLKRMKVKKTQDLRTNITLLSIVTIIFIIVCVIIIFFL